MMVKEPAEAQLKKVEIGLKVQVSLTKKGRSSRR